MFSTPKDLFPIDGTENIESIWFKARMIKGLNKMPTTSKFLMASKLKVNFDTSKINESQRGMLLISERADLSNEKYTCSINGNSYSSRPQFNIPSIIINFNRSKYYKAFKFLCQEVKAYAEDIKGKTIHKQSNVLGYYEKFEGETIWDYGMYKSMNTNSNRIVNGFIINRYNDVAVIFSRTSRNISMDGVSRWKMVNKIDIVFEINSEVQILSVPVSKIIDEETAFEYIQKKLRNIKSKELILIHPDIDFYTEYDIGLKDII